MSADPAYRIDGLHDPAISAGDHDAYIRNWATAAKQYGSTVNVRFDHEMDGNWFTWGATRFDNTPAKFITAWRHVVGIFRSVGMSNVKFLWSPYTRRHGCIRRLVRGRRLASRASNGFVPWGPWISMYSALKSGVSKSRQVTLNRPIIVAELGSTPIGGDKATWIRNGYPAVYTNFPVDQGSGLFQREHGPDRQADWSHHEPAYCPRCICRDRRGHALPGQVRFVKQHPTADDVRRRLRAMLSAERPPRLGLNFAGRDVQHCGHGERLRDRQRRRHDEGDRRDEPCALLSSAKGQNVDLTFRASTDKLAAGDAQFHLRRAARIDSLNEYRVKLRLPTNRDVQIQASQVVGGHESALTSPVPWLGSRAVPEGFIRPATTNYRDQPHHDQDPSVG